MQYCYLNGKIVPLEKALIRIDDIAIFRGYGVFDFLRTYNGKPFLLQEHLLRLKNSARALSLRVPISDKEVEEIVFKLLKKNKMQDAQVRIILTGGQTINGMGYDATKPTFAILIEPLALPPTECYIKGGKLMTNTHMRHFPTSKTISYLNTIALNAEKKKQGAIEVLYLFHDYVLECSVSNFFLVKGNKVITPKENVLLGMTRNLLVDLLAKDFTIEERDIHVSELKDADEVFITATNKEVLPIVQIDDMKIGNGKIGEKTKKIMQLFADYTEKFAK